MLLAALAELREFHPIPAVEAFTHLGHGAIPMDGCRGLDFSASMAQLCQGTDVASSLLE